MLYSLLFLLLFSIIPAGVIWICRRVALLGKLGPIMVLYAIGMVIGNLPFISGYMAPVQELLPNVLIPLAIPMMLFCSTFTTKQAKLQLKIVSSGFISVAFAVIVGYLLFGSHLEDGSKIGGIITGMYTGGTLNGAALQAIFKINSESFVLINSYDIIISFVYFIFLFGIGIKLFRRLYGHNEQKQLSESDNNLIANSIELANRNPYNRVFTKDGVKEISKIIGVTLIVVAVSGVVALLLPQRWFMVVFILMLTTLGVGCSFILKVKQLTLSYDIGMYLIYIFSITIASTADFSNLDLASGINQFCFMTVAVFISLILHTLICRVLNVDADSMIISSVAFINSPPFVPMASAAMNSREALVTGLAAGIIGYAAGNHLGVIMERLLGILQ